MTWQDDVQGRYLLVLNRQAIGKQALAPLNGGVFEKLAIEGKTVRIELVTSLAERRLLKSRAGGEAIVWEHCAWRWRG